MHCSVPISLFIWYSRPIEYEDANNGMRIKGNSATVVLPRCLSQRSTYPCNTRSIDSIPEYVTQMRNARCRYMYNSRVGSRRVWNNPHSSSKRASQWQKLNPLFTQQVNNNVIFRLAFKIEQAFLWQFHETEISATGCLSIAFSQYFCYGNRFTVWMTTARHAVAIMINTGNTKVWSTLKITGIILTPWYIMFAIIYIPRTIAIYMCFCIGHL